MATLFFVQIQNADNACESPQSVPGIDVEELRGIGFENSFSNPGGGCTYHMDDGSGVHPREPGWWFSGTVASFVVTLAVLVVFVVWRKGHHRVLFGLTTLVAPPLGFVLAGAAARRAPSAAPVAL